MMKAGVRSRESGVRRIWLLAWVMAVGGFWTSQNDGGTAGAAEPIIWTENLYSQESGWDGYAGDQSAAFYGPDTARWIIYWASWGLSPWADDLEFALQCDTTLASGAVDSMMFTSPGLVAYPIVYDPNNAVILNHPLARGQVLYEKPVTLYETTTGRAASAINFDRDSTYIFHSNSWWSGMNTRGVLIRAISAPVDSFYVIKAWDQYLHRQ